MRATPSQIRFPEDFCHCCYILHLSDGQIDHQYRATQKMWAKSLLTDKWQITFGQQIYAGVDVRALRSVAYGFPIQAHQQNKNPPEATDGVWGTRRADWARTSNCRSFCSGRLARNRLASSDRDTITEELEDVGCVDWRTGSGEGSRSAGLFFASARGSVVVTLLTEAAAAPLESELPFAASSEEKAGRAAIPSDSAYKI